MKTATSVVCCARPSSQSHFSYSQPIHWQYLAIFCTHARHTGSCLKWNTISFIKNINIAIKAQSYLWWIFVSGCKFSQLNSILFSPTKFREFHSFLLSERQLICISVLFSLFFALSISADSFDQRSRHVRADILNSNPSELSTPLISANLLPLANSKNIDDSICLLIFSLTSLLRWDCGDRAREKQIDDDRIFSVLCAFHTIKVHSRIGLAAIRSRHWFTPDTKLHIASSVVRSTKCVRSPKARNKEKSKRAKLSSFMIRW